MTGPVPADAPVPPGTTADPADPFGTARLRAAVLQTWASSPDRFREDANAEELLSHGYTRGRSDRVLVELVANAVDAAAAAAAGEPARVRLRLVRTAAGEELRVANSGVPLTAEGVRALASLRASAKRDGDSVGRFGVGFTAVRALSDAPVVLSGGTGVAFSAAATREAVGRLPADVRAELDRRDGVVPALRLCWPVRAAADDPVPDGLTTEVRLPLRAGTGAAAVLDEWIRTARHDLWWALPALERVELPGLTFVRSAVPHPGPDAGPDSGSGGEPDGPTRGRPTGAAERVVITEVDGAGRTARSEHLVVTRTGELPDELLADRPVEERGRRSWRICWALPLTDDPAAAEEVDLFAAAAPRPALPVGAPTPTDTLLGLPARLTGTFGVDETRRHLADDAVTRYLLEQAVPAYLDLVAALPPADRWELVPPGGFGSGAVDAAVRDAVLTGWRDLPLLRSVLGDPVAPATAITVEGVDPETAALLGEGVPDLVVVPPGARTAAVRLGVRVIDAAQALAELAGLSRPPAWWGRLHRGLRELPAEALTGVPVPLADGRTVVGARGVLVADAALAALLPRLGAVLPALRWAHPEADASLLLRCGAERADASAILRSAAVLDAVTAVRDDLDADLLDAVRPPGDGDEDEDGDGDGDGDEAEFDEPDERASALAALVLDLIAAGGSPVPAGLVLSTEDDEPWPADDLLLPGTPFAAVLEPDAVPPVGDGWRAVWDDAVLAAAGVRDRPLLIAVDDPRADDLLPDLESWPAPAGRQEAAQHGIADLDLVVDWPGLLTLVAGDPALLDAVCLPAGGTSYSAWWMRRWARLDGLPLGAHRSAGALPPGSPLELLVPLPAVLPAALAAAVGVVTDEEAALASLRRDPGPLLAAFCDPHRRLEPAAVAWWGERLVDALTDRGSGGTDPDTDTDTGTDTGEPPLPDLVRTSDGEVRDPEQVVVPDGPWWAQLLSPGAVLALDRPARVTAAVFDLDVAAAAALTVTGDEPVPAVVPAGLLGEGPVPVVVGGLTVAGAGVPARRVAWWPTVGGIACDGSDLGLSRALAWSSGRWSERHAVLAALRGERDADVIERVWDR